MDNRQRIFKQGLLAEKRYKLEELETRADRYRKDINIYLFSSEGIKGMERDKARQAWEDLTSVFDKFDIFTEEIKRIEEEL